MVVSSIKDSVSDAVSSAKDAVSDVASAGSSVVDKIGSGVSSVFDKDIFEDMGLSKLVGGAVDIVTGQRSLGSLASSALDSLGLPDWAADMAGVAVDVMTGNKKGAINQGLEMARGVADAAGIDKAADFLDTAGDVVGMANGSVSSPGDFKAIASETVASAASGNAKDGLISSVMSEAGLGALEDKANVASDVAGYVDSATEAVSSLGDGDASALGDGLIDVMGGSGATLSELVDGIVDSETAASLGESIGEQMGESASLMDMISDRVDLSGELSQMETPTLLERLGIAPEEAGPTAASTVDFARTCGGVDPQSETPGSDVIDSPAGQSFVEHLQQMIREKVGADVGQINVRLDAAVVDMANTAGGCMDMAALSSEVASEVVDTLQQLGSMSETGRVGDMARVEVRV